MRCRGKRGIKRLIEGKKEPFRRRVITKRASKRKQICGTLFQENQTGKQRDRGGSGKKKIPMRPSSTALKKEETSDRGGLAQKGRQLVTLSPGRSP